MKEPTRAPLFACLYPGLCDVARRHGYALAIHGTVTTDLDLIAVPWVNDPEPAEPEVLVAALMKHISACGYDDLLRRQGFDERTVSQICDRQGFPDKNPEQKPHGRKAWNLHLDCGCKVDLSVLPKILKKDA